MITGIVLPLLMFLFGCNWVKESTKAVLLSAFVFPGIGHLVLKKYLLATILVSVFSIALYSFVVDIVDRTQLVVDQVLSGKIPMDVTAITNAVHNQSAQESNYVSLVLFIVWLLSMVDSYRIGSKIDDINRKQKVATGKTNK